MWREQWILGGNLDIIRKSGCQPKFVLGIYVPCWMRTENISLQPHKLNCLQQPNDCFGVLRGGEIVLRLAATILLLGPRLQKWPQQSQGPWCDKTHCFIRGTWCHLCGSQWTLDSFQTKTLFLTEEHNQSFSEGLAPQEVLQGNLHIFKASLLVVCRLLVTKELPIAWWPYY